MDVPADAVKGTDEQFDQLAAGNVQAFDAVVAESIKEPAPKEEAKTEPEAPAPTGVLAKDGEHVLPYSALEAAREETRKEREAREAAEARAKQIEEQLKAAREPEKKEEVDEVAQRVAEMRAHAQTLLDADFPSEADSIAKAADLLEKEHAGRLGANDAKARYEQDAKAREEQMAAEMQKEQMRVIESNPTLNFYFNSKEHGALFDKISGIEELNRRTDPAFAKLPLEERAKLAVEEFYLGNPKAPRPPRVQTQEEIKRKAREAVDAAAAPNVESLSDIPAGSAPASNVIDGLFEKSSMSLIQDLERLSDEQFQKVAHSLY